MLTVISLSMMNESDSLQSNLYMFTFYGKIKLSCDKCSIICSWFWSVFNTNADTFIIFPLDAFRFPHCHWKHFPDNNYNTYKQKLKFSLFNSWFILSQLKHCFCFIFVFQVIDANCDLALMFKKYKEYEGHIMGKYAAAN